jgi:hypothetical protein
MRAKAVEQASRPVVRRPGQAITPVSAEDLGKTDDKHSVSINISVPKLKLSKPTIKIPPQLLVHKKWLICGAVCLVAVIGLTTVLVITKGSKQGSDTTAVLSAAEERPNFTFLLPRGDATGKVFQYNRESQTVSFTDSIGGVRIVIHQTPLNKDLKEDTESKLEKIAQDNAFNEKIVTANPTAYLGTSAKGPQTVLFVKNDLQVFIASDKKIDNHDWAEYITSLQ